MAIKDNSTKICDGDSANIKASVAQRGAKGAQTVEIVDSSGNQITSFPAGLSIPEHDKIDLSYTGDNLTTVVYSKNGSTVATLTLTYSGSDLISVSKT